MVKPELKGIYADLLNSGYDIEQSEMELNVLNLQPNSLVSPHVNEPINMTKLYEENKIKVPRFEESAGFYTTKERSRQMAQIKGGNTKPEIRFRKALFNAGVRYRVNSKSLPGKPDISNKSKRFVVFVDGDFWHGYNWKEKKEKIKSNRGFWIPKIERNMQRDREVNIALQSKGFKVFRFWETEVKKELGVCLNQVLVYIEKFNRY